MRIAGPVRERFAPFREFLAEPPDRDAIERLRAAEGIGHALGDKALLARLERLTMRTLQRARRGPNPRHPDPEQER